MALGAGYGHVTNGNRWCERVFFRHGNYFELGLFDLSTPRWRRELRDLESSRALQSPATWSIDLPLEWPAHRGGEKAQCRAAENYG